MPTARIYFFKPYIQKRIQLYIELHITNFNNYQLYLSTALASCNYNEPLKIVKSNNCQK